MQFNEFIGQVQHKAKLATQEDAIKATRATLQTLSERLYGNEAEHIASQLPEEIGNYLKNGKSEKFSIDDFFKRVSEKEGADIPEAVFHARAVCDVLKEAISAGEIKHITDQLPEEFNKLFAGSEGRMPS